MSKPDALIVADFVVELERATGRMFEQHPEMTLCDIQGAVALWMARAGVASQISPEGIEQAAFGIYCEILRSMENVLTVQIEGGGDDGSDA